MDKYTEMLVFSKAADLGSFSAAARELDLTPSAVSKLITRLEDRLGARLFQRTTRKLSLTAEGHAFHDRCGAILNEIQQAEDAVMALHDRVSGTLRVTTISAFARIQMIKLMPEFMTQYPELRVELELSEREVDLVGEGVDVAIVLSDGLTDESLVARRLAVNKRIICASQAYLDRHGTPNTPEDLLQHNCLTHSSIQHFNDWEFNTGRRGTQPSSQRKLSHQQRVGTARSGQGRPRHSASCQLCGSAITEERSGCATAAGACGGQFQYPAGLPAPASPE